MKIEVNGNEVIISGKKYGETEIQPRKIKIYLNEEEDSEYFSFSIICGNFIHGCLPSVTFYKDDIVFQNNLASGRTVKSKYNL